MRLRILDSGHGFGTKALFALIQAISGQPVLDVVKLVKYRDDFYGKPMSSVTHETMRGPSTWSVGDRELMAAFVAKVNQCEFCTKAHTAVAQRAYGGGKKVSDLLSDLNTALIDEPMRATLLMLGKLMHENTVDADEMRAAAAGTSRQQIEDALAVCFSFNVIVRLADAVLILSRSEPFCRRRFVNTDSAFAVSLQCLALALRIDSHEGRQRHAIRDCLPIRYN